MRQRSSNRYWAAGGDDWQFKLAHDCQIIAGEALECDIGVLLQKTRELLARVPPHPNAAAQAVAAFLLTKTVRGIARRASLEGDPAFVQMLLNLAPPSITVHWRCAAEALIDYCVATHRSRLEMLSRPPYSDPVQRTLAAIDRHYGDCRFGLRRVSEAVGVSRYHLSRRLKLETGTGFVDHLRRRRVAAAQELLRSATLSVKEIAAAVGYGSTRQFERDVKRLLHVHPSALQRSCHSPAHKVSQLRKNRRTL